MGLERDKEMRFVYVRFTYKSKNALVEMHFCFCIYVCVYFLHTFSGEENGAKLTRVLETKNS